ncbi:DoxX family protein [Candidatus Woesearchaeota archaeon]|nr:MAG: DoxX family protein [Candidatus Woesearchaeota archaeon]
MKKDLAPFFLRIGLGIWLVVLSLKFLFKAKVIALAANIVAEMGVPLGVSRILMIIASWVGVVLGIMFLLGFLTRIAAVLLGLAMLFSIFVLNWFLPAALMGPWGGFVLKDIVILGASLSMLFTGAGWLSLDELLKSV